MFLVFGFVCGTPPSRLKVGVWVVAYSLQHFSGALKHFSVSPRPLGFGFLGFGAKGLVPGLDNKFSLPKCAKLLPTLENNTK